MREIVEKIRFALVGGGMWAQEAHIPFLINNPSTELIGIVDTEPSRVQGLTDRFSVPFSAPTLADLLSKTEIDAVVISTPHASHFEIAHAALKQGIHVHVDKPICNKVMDVNALIELAKRAGVVLSTHAQRKYMPGQSRLKWYVENHFGALYHISGSLWQPIFADYATSWRADHKLAAGGILMDSGYHVIDTLFSILGPKSLASIGRVSMAASNADKASDAFATLIFAIDQTVVQVTAFRGTPRTLKKEQYEVLGDGGYVGLLYTGSGSGKQCQLTFAGFGGTKPDSERLSMVSSYNLHPLHLFVEQETIAAEAAA
jgi:predicted dehydrogenase